MSAEEKTSFQSVAPEEYERIVLSEMRSVPGTAEHKTVSGLLVSMGYKRWLDMLHKIHLNADQIEGTKRRAVERGTLPEDEFDEWYERHAWFVGHVEQKITEVQSLWDQTDNHASHLRDAIVRHKATSDAHGLTPEAHDLELWEVLDKTS